MTRSRSLKGLKPVLNSISPRTPSTAPPPTSTLRARSTSLARTVTLATMRRTITQLSQKVRLFATSVPSPSL